MDDESGDDERDGLNDIKTRQYGMCTAHKCTYRCKKKFENER